MGFGFSNLLNYTGVTMRTDKQIKQIREDIIRLIRTNEFVTVKQLNKITKLGYYNARHYLNKLAEEGLIYKKTDVNVNLGHGTWSHRIHNHRKGEILIYTIDKDFTL